MNDILYLNKNNTLPIAYTKYVMEVVEDFKLKNNGKIPTKKEINDLGLSIQPLIDTFGGWKKSLVSLGLIKNNKSISEELIELKEKLNRTPTLLDLKKANISINLVVKEYGSWNNAKKVLNGKDDILTATEVENNIIELVKDTNKVPTVKEIKEADINIKPLLNKYDSWTNAKKVLNINSYVNKNKSEKYILSKEEIKEIRNKIIPIQNELKKKPLISDLKNNNIPLRKLIKHFGSWNKAYEELNLQEELIKMYKEMIVKESKKLGKVITIKELKNLNIPITILTANQKWSEIVEELKLNEIEKEHIKASIVETANKLGYRPLMGELSKNKIQYNKVLSDYNSISDMYDKLGVPENDKTKNVDLSDVILKIKLLKEILGETPSLEQAISNKIKVRKAIRVYGTWKNFLKANNLCEDENLDDIINQVKELANELGHTPSIAELKENKIKYARLQYKYGSYNKALLAMGLTVNRILSEEDEAFIINQIKDLYKKLGHAPSLKELKDNKIKTGKILNKYKGIVNLYKKINIPLNSEISKKELINKLNEICVKLKKFPTKSEAKKEGINIKLVKTYFGSWKQCEIEFNNKKRKERLELEKKAFIELALQLEKAPTLEEAKEYGINTRDLIVNYKGWKNVCNSLYEKSIEKEAI